MKKLIQKLVEAVGPSGYEGKVRELVRAEIGGLADEVKVDALGNLIARMGVKGPDGLRIMISGHMDEIGVIATHVDDNGFVRFTTIGGVGAATCIGGRVAFLNGVHGLIYMERLENSGHLPNIDQLYIDVGAPNREDCPVKVGDVAVFERPYIELNGRLVSKAMDDRIAVAVMIQAMKELKRQPPRAVFRLQHPGGSGAARGDDRGLWRGPRTGRGGGRDAYRGYPQGREDGSLAGQRPGGESARQRDAGRSARGALDG